MISISARLRDARGLVVVGPANLFRVLCPRGREKIFVAHRQKVVTRAFRVEWSDYEFLGLCKDVGVMVAVAGAVVVC